jgi:hypothetical protein
MHTDGDELIPRVDGLPEEAVFIGSGLAVARRPGMTLQSLSVWRGVSVFRVMVRLLGSR